MSRSSDARERKTYPLKFGKTFDKKSDVSYNTLKLDFKPVSLGSSKDMMLEVGGENSNQNQVNATIPGKHGSGSNNAAPTVYKGHKAPYGAKDCLLIVDEVTGEVTLERLGENISLKKSRPEGGSKAQGNRGRPGGPLPSPGNSDKMDQSPGDSTNDFSPAPSTSPVPSPSQPPPPLLHSQSSYNNHMRSSGPSQAAGFEPWNKEPSASNKNDYRRSSVQMDGKAAAALVPKKPSPKKLDDMVMSSSSSGSSSSSSSSDSSSDSDAETNIESLLEDNSSKKKKKGRATTSHLPQLSIGSIDTRTSLPPDTTAMGEKLLADLDVSDDSEDDIMAF